MTKINQKPLPASLQLTDEMPLNRSGADFRGNFQKVLDLMIAQGLLDEDAAIAAGFLTGDPSAIYAENQSDGQKWQIGQKAIGLTVDGDNLTPDCEQNDMFSFYPAGGTREIQPPINVSYSNLGGQYNPFKFTIYVRFMNTTPEITFHSNYSPIPGSKPWDKSGQINVVECWYHGLGGYYRINNSLPEEGASQTIEGIITSAQILDSYSNPVELIPAPGAGKVIMVELVNYWNGDGTIYATNTFGVFRHQGQAAGAQADLSEPGTMFCPVFLHYSDNATAIVNKSFIFETMIGNPETGTFDIWYSITYRIINDPFA